MHRKREEAWVRNETSWLEPSAEPSRPFTTIRDQYSNDDVVAITRTIRLAQTPKTARMAIFLKNGRDAPSQPCRRSAFLLLQSGKNIRLFPAIQIQSSGFWPGKNNHHASKHGFPSPRSAPTWESFSLL